MGFCVERYSNIRTVPVSLCEFDAVEFASQITPFSLLAREGRNSRWCSVKEKVLIPEDYMSQRGVQQTAEAIGSVFF